MNKSIKSGTALFDWFLIIGVAALLCVVAILVLSSPTSWSWCLKRLDARNWNHWVWTGVIAALIVTLLGIRYWRQLTIR
jgi:hypothetical protein